jgi:hypothetical protein
MPVIKCWYRGKKILEHFGSNVAKDLVKKASPEI